jgi:hypothetical protein
MGKKVDYEHVWKNLLGGEAQLIGVRGGGVRGRPDPEERCTKTPDSDSGYTPPGGKAKGAGGLDSKVWRHLLKYVNW